MRQVYSSYSDLCHVWAHGLQETARSGNMRFEGAYLYSYGTCIGERFKINGNVIFVFNDFGFSRTTYKHQRAAHMAVPHDDDNVYVFHVHRDGWGDGYITCEYHYTWFRNKEDYDEMLKRSLARFASLWLSNIWNECLSVRDNRRMDLGVYTGTFGTFVKFLEATGCMTLGKLMRMNDSELIKHLYIREFNGLSYLQDKDVRKVRKFMKLLSSDAECEQIVDYVAGKGTYGEWKSRTEYLRLAARVRYMSKKLGLDEYIKLTEYRKRKKDGTLIRWMLEKKKSGMSCRIQQKESSLASERRQRVKRRLERHIGMCGWKMTYFHNYHEHTFDFFDYGGETFVFKGASYLCERHLTEREYDEFRLMPRDRQESFIAEKRRWMLDDLKSQQRQHDSFVSDFNERMRIAEEERQKRAQMTLAVEHAKENGDVFRIAELWREGYVSNSYVSGLGASVFHGGNVLLRVSGNGIVSSKGMRVSMDEARRMWAIVKRWHEDESSFVRDSERIATQLSYFSVSRYERDILIAGCHAISYWEMHNVAVQAGLEESAASEAV